MRWSLLAASSLFLTACASPSRQSVEMEAPPWGWTEVSADLPTSFHPLQRTVIADTKAAREMHLAVETNATGTTRSVFVSVYERPGIWARAYRQVRFGDVPHSANLGNGYAYARIDPSSLPLPAGMADAGAAWRMDNPEQGESGVVVQHCEGDLCTEAFIGGQIEDATGSEVHHTDLLAALTIRR